MKRVHCGIAARLSAITIAGAQTPASLEQQLEELKQQYAETTRRIEQRIAALERQVAAQRGSGGEAAGEHCLGGRTRGADSRAGCGATCG
jgi:hypothetical protein